MKILNSIFTIIIYLSVLFYSTETIAQLEFSGVQTASGSGNGNPSYDTGVDMVMDNSGNSFVTGSYSGSINFGKFILTSNNLSSDVFVVKYDPDGNILWAGYVIRLWK